MNKADPGMAINAAVIRAKGGPFSIEALTLEAPRRGEVLVRIVATRGGSSGAEGTRSREAEGARGIETP